MRTSSPCLWSDKLGIAGLSGILGLCLPKGTRPPHCSQSGEFLDGGTVAPLLSVPLRRQEYVCGAYRLAGHAEKKS